MKESHRYKIVFVGMCCFCLHAAAAQTLSERQENRLETGVGNSAPTFALPDVKGRQFRLEDYRGRPVVLNFWAFWCDTWKAELPHLKELAGRQEEVKFRLLAVSVDGTRLQEFLTITKGQLPFPVLLDAGGNISRSYRIAHVPTVVILDSAGKIRYVKSGYPGNEAVLHELRRIAARESDERSRSRRN